MKTKFSRTICSLASILLALTLTLSCSNDDSENNGSLSGNPEYEQWKEYLKYYDPYDEEQRCQSGITEFKCGDKGWYNPLNYSCSYSCGGSDGSGEVCYDYTLGTIEICGNDIYVSSSTRRCQGGVLQRQCGDVWYNRETHYCDYELDSNTGTEISTVKARERCGSKYYAPDEYTRCQSGVIEERCGYGENVAWYNPDTHYCSYNYDNISGGTNTVKAIVRCGNEYIRYDDERCNNGVVEYRCGSSNDANAAWYNEMTQSCNWSTGEVRAKVRCGG